RDLERAHEAKPGDVRRLHRRDVLSLVEDVACRRLQELGTEVEARGLPGPGRADQRVNGPLADLQRNIANGENPRELLGQSVGFENELICQTNFPHQPSPRSPKSRVADCLYSGWFSRTPWNVLG